MAKTILIIDDSVSLRQLVRMALTGAGYTGWSAGFQALRSHGIPVLNQALEGTGYRKVSWVVGPSDPVVETVFPGQCRHQGR